MPRPLLRLTLASLLLALAADARADLPPPSNSIFPSCITLVGSHGGVPASVGSFEVLVRDLANNPIPNSVVTIDLSLVTDLRLCDDQPDPNVFLDCANHRVTALTNVFGRVSFTLTGGGHAGGARTFANAARVYADGFLLGYASVNTFDLDGAAGLGANDLAQWLGDFGTGQAYALSDYDCDGFLGANDLSQWLTVFGQGTQTASCAASCP